MNIWQAAYYLANRIVGWRTKECYEEFLRLEEMSVDEARKLRDTRLRSLLEHASRSIPFYRDRVAEGPLHLSRFPVVTKADLRQEFWNFMDDELREQFTAGRARPGSGWVEVKTGGSTGVPVTVIHDRDFRDRGRASALFCQYLCGFPLGTPHIQLWGSMKEINHMRDAPQRRIMNWIRRVRLINAFGMGPAQMRAYIDLFNGSEFDHIMAYVDAADQLARFVQNEGLQVKPFKSLMSCAGTLTEAVRERLLRHLTRRVYNTYGTRECLVIACESEPGCLDVFGNHVYLEIVDEHGDPVPPGASGRILITLLGNLRFPVIRYEIGDMGKMASPEERGRLPYPPLLEVTGRIQECLTNSEGTHVSSVYIRHLIGVVHDPGWINRFQFVQTSAGIYTLYLQVDHRIEADRYEQVVALIRRDLLAVMGRDSTIEIQRVELIPESDSGKFLYVKNLAMAATR